MQRYIECFRFVDFIINLTWAVFPDISMNLGEIYRTVMYPTKNPGPFILGVRDTQSTIRGVLIQIVRSVGSSQRKLNRKAHFKMCLVKKSMSSAGSNDVLLCLTWRFLVIFPFLFGLRYFNTHRVSRSLLEANKIVDLMVKQISRINLW